MLQKLSYVDWVGLTITVCKAVLGLGLFVAVGLSLVLLNLVLIGGAS